MFYCGPETLPATNGSRRPREQSSISESAVRPRKILAFFPSSSFFITGSSCHAPTSRFKARTRAADGRRRRSSRWGGCGLPSKATELVHLGHTGRVPTVRNPVVSILFLWYVTMFYRYTGDKARDSVEHFMELFDTDLVHVPAIRPSWMCVCCCACVTMLLDDGCLGTDLLMSILSSTLQSSSNSNSSSSSSSSSITNSNSSSSSSVKRAERCQGTFNCEASVVALSTSLGLTIGPCTQGR